MTSLPTISTPSPACCTGTSKRAPAPPLWTASRWSSTTPATTRAAPRSTAATGRGGPQRRGWASKGSSRVGKGQPGQGAPEGPPGQGLPAAPFGGAAGRGAGSGCRDGRARSACCFSMPWQRATSACTSSVQNHGKTTTITNARPCITFAAAPCHPTNAPPIRPSITPGFEEGIRTMKVGGKRRIVVPPKLGPPIGPSTFFSAKQCEVRRRAGPPGRLGGGN
jgi:hypothetical protein